MKKIPAVAFVWFLAVVLWFGVILDVTGKDSVTVSVADTSEKKENNSPDTLEQSDNKQEDAVTDYEQSGKPSCININQASKEKLMTLPGIGPVIAQRIIENRAVEGPFRQLADVQRVKGIGPKTAQKIAGQICF